MTLEEALREALSVARYGARAGEQPYGAVVLGPSGRVVARAHDQVKQDGDLTSHAELLAVRRAARAQGPDLAGHLLVCTVEPCAMCFSGAWTAGVSALAYGVGMTELKALLPEAMDEIVMTAAELNELAARRLEIVSGVLRRECLALWSESSDSPQ
jgi:tRNA(adenine34) deaminase